MRLRVAAIAFTSSLVILGCKTPASEVETPKVQEHKLTAEHVEKYVKFYAAWTPVAIKYGEDMKPFSPPSGIAALQKAEATTSAFREQEAKLRAEAGLDKEQTEELNEAVSSVLDGRKLCRMGGGEKLCDATDARERYGAGAVDAIIKNEEALAANREKIPKAALGTK